MAIKCPNCSVSAAIAIEGKLVFFGGQCMELLGTPFVHEFEQCPVLAAAMGREVNLPVHSERIVRVIFRPVFEDGAWEIEALCPNSVVERIKWFRSEAEAKYWIAGEESRSWLLAKGYLQ
jgi:hypothetical protein